MDSPPPRPRNGNPADEEAAARKAALWVGAYQGSNTISYSLTEVVGGKQGISIINTFNDARWLVWDAAVMMMD